MPQPVSYNPGTPVSGSIQENSISYVVDGQQRNYRGGFGGLSWMSEVPAENNVIFIGNSTSLGRGPAGKPLFYPAYNNSSANIVYAANTLPGSPRNFTTTGSAYNWVVTNNFFINNSDNPIPRIDADELVLYVDANQPTSYPQTGTSWYDASGFGNNGSLINGPTFNSSLGTIFLDGVDDFVTCSITNIAPTTFNNQDITFEMLCSTTTNDNAYHTLMSVNDINYPSGNYAHITLGQWRNGLQNGSFYWQIDTTVQSYLIDSSTTYTSTNIATGKFFHVVGTWSKNGASYTGTLYVNGTSIASSNSAITTYTASNATKAYIGSDIYNSYRQGNINNSKIYSKALSLSEVKQNYFQSNIVQDGLVFMVDANNLVSYPKSGTAWYNLTGSVASATLTNGPTFNNINGGIINFDGVDDYAVTSNFPSLSNWSTEMWLNPNVYTTAQKVILDVNLGIRFEISNGFFNSHFGDGSGWIYTNLPSTTQIAPNTWFHVIVTVDASVNYQAKVYVNGVLENTTGTSSGTTPNVPLYIARFTGAGGYEFNGKIANTRIYSKALTASEVQQNYQATKDKFQGQQIVTNGLIINLDSANKDSYPGTGTTWTDLSGNANNGTLINGPSFNIDSGGCIDFDGIDDSVTGNKPVLSAVTLEYYCKLTGNSTGGYPHLVMSGNTFIGLVGNTSSARFRIAINPGAGYSEITSDLLNPSATFKLYSMTYDGTTVKMFVNGVQQASTMNIASTFELMTGNAYQLSAVTTPSYDKAPNKMAAFRIYNRALSATEIAQNYNATKGRFGL